MNQHTKFDAEHAVLKNIRANYLTSFALPQPSLRRCHPTPLVRRPVSPPPPLFAGVTGTVHRACLVRGGRPARELLPRARGGDECRWGTAKTRFGANIRRASLSFCSEESPRAHRQRVPAVMVREAWTRAHEDGCGPSLPAPRPQPYGTVMRVGAPRGPRTERGLLWRCPTPPQGGVEASHRIGAHGTGTKLLRECEGAAGCAAAHGTVGASAACAARGQPVLGTRHGTLPRISGAARVAGAGLPETLRLRRTPQQPPLSYGCQNLGWSN